VFELLKQLRTEIRGIWRYRWVAIAVAWAICSIAWLFIYTMPNIYEARAQVFVDADSRLVEVMGQVGVAPGVGATVFVVRQAMLGRPQLEKVAAETGLDQRATNEEELDSLILGLQDRISVSSGRSTQARNLYTISFMDRSREMAVAIVTSLIKTFERDVLALSDKGSVKATGYLDDQLTYYSNVLSDAEQKLATVKKNNIGLLPDDTGGIFESLQQEMDLLKQLRLNLSIETDRRKELRSQLQSENPDLPQGVNAVGTAEITGSPTENSIRELEAARSNLLLSFTERHPDVVAIGEQLEQLYRKRDREMAALAGQSSGMEGIANATNPVYQSVQIALNQSGVRIAGYRSEIAQHDAVVRKLNSQINTIPDVEAEYAKLNRDYDQYRSLYNELLVQKERERMGEAGEERDVVSFNMIQPPVAALEPVAPKRTFFLFFALVFGLGCGAGVAFILHASNPVFSDMATLRKLSGRPVLGAVSMTWLEEHRARQYLGLASFSSAAVILVLTFVCLIAFQDAGVAALQSLLSADS